jgi:hypothetical protein
MSSKHLELLPASFDCPRQAQAKPSQDFCKIGFPSRNFAMPLSPLPHTISQYPRFSWIWLKYSLVSSLSSIMRASSVLLIKMPPISSAFHARSLPVQCHMPPKSSLPISNTMFPLFGVSAPHNAASSVCCSRAMPPTVKSFYGLCRRLLVSLLLCLLDW